MGGERKGVGGQYAGSKPDWEEYKCETFAKIRDQASSSPLLTCIWTCDMNFLGGHMKYLGKFCEVFAKIRDLANSSPPLTCIWAYVYNICICVCVYGYGYGYVYVYGYGYGYGYGYESEHGCECEREYIRV